MDIRAEYDAACVKLAETMDEVLTVPTLSAEQRGRAALQVFWMRRKELHDANSAEKGG